MVKYFVISSLYNAIILIDIVPVVVVVVLAAFIKIATYKRLTTWNGTSPK